MIPLTARQTRSQTPSPADHIRTLAELLRPAGPDLARRLVSALLLAPAEEREAIVASIERKMVELYAPAEQAEESACGTDDEPRMMNVIDAPVQRSGYVEQKIHTYEIKDEDADQDAGDQHAARVG